MRFRHGNHSKAVCVALLLLATAGCEFIAGFVGGSPADQLAELALESFASPGAPFMEGRFGTDTIGVRTEMGERSWEVNVPGARAVTWAFEVTKVEVLPVYGGDAFITWLETTARGLGMRGFIPADAKSMISSGSVVAVGDLAIGFGPSDRRGRTPMERVGLLRADSNGENWSIEPEGNRSARVLRDALRLVSADMIARDDRVHSCMGSVEARGVERELQLECVGSAFASDFGG
jgi:hypothetical protein